MFLRVIIIFTLSTSFLMSHQDPIGEIRPKLLTVDGHLKVVFQVNGSGDKKQYKIAPILNDVLGAAVEISESKVIELESASPPGTWIVRDETTFVFGAEHALKPCIFRLQGNRPELIMPKWGKEKEYWGWARSYAVTDKHYFFLVGKMSDLSGGFGDLHLYIFDRVSLDLAHHIHVGDADGILQEPTFSSLVVVKNTVFFCWSKRNDNNPPSLVMAELPPSGKLREHTIQKEFHWNALVDIAATDKSVVVAYDLPVPQNAISKIFLYHHEVK